MSRRVETIPLTRIGKSGVRPNFGKKVEFSCGLPDIVMPVSYPSVI